MLAGNRAVSPESEIRKGDQMIKVSDEAREKLRGTLERNPGKYLRIIMKGIG